MPTRKIRKHNFVFDDEGLGFYETEFSKEGYEIIIFNDYLSRRHLSSGKIEHFHRWYYEKKTKSLGKRIVHHINSKENENQFYNLIDLSREEHKAIHDWQKENRAKFATKKSIREFVLNVTGQEVLVKPKKHRKKELKMIGEEFDRYNNQTEKQIVTHKNSIKWNIPDKKKNSPIKQVDTNKNSLTWNIPDKNDTTQIVSKRNFSSNKYLRKSRMNGKKFILFLMILAFIYLGYLFVQSVRAFGFGMSLILWISIILIVTAIIFSNNNKTS